MMLQLCIVSCNGCENLLRQGIFGKTFSVLFQLNKHFIVLSQIQQNYPKTHEKLKQKQLK